MIQLRDGHAVDIKSVQNARELGGYRGLDGRKVKHGLLLRTASISGISEEDKAVLRRLGLSLVIDFRDLFEVEANPEPELEGVRKVHIRVVDIAADASMKGIAGAAAAPVIPSDLSKMAELFASPRMREGFLAFLRTGLDLGALYRNILKSEMGKTGYRQFFRLLLEQPEGEAALWHCSAGKDRTGIAAALLLSVLGTDRETILDDYARTNEYMAESVASIQKGVAMLTDDPDLIRASGNLAGIRREYMEDTLRELDGQYGSSVGYVKDALGLTEAELTALREKYLD